MLIFSLALVVVELLAIWLFFTKFLLQNLTRAHAATCRQKLAADFSEYKGIQHNDNQHETPSIKYLIVTLSIKYSQHNDTHHTL